MNTHFTNPGWVKDPKTVHITNNHEIERTPEKKHKKTWLFVSITIGRGVTTIRSDSPLVGKQRSLTSVSL
jgi:hypothetical protein